MKETDYERYLVNRILEKYPGAVDLKGNSRWKVGFPDRLFLFDSTWFALEFKDSADARKGPNQSYYVDLLNSMSFASFAYPENERMVLNGIQRSLRSLRSTRIP